MPSQGASYGLQYRARAIAAPSGDSGASHWLAGTTTITEQNEIQLLQLDCEKERLTSLRTFSHPQEIWSILPNPKNGSQFATTYTEGRSLGVSIWSILGESTDLNEVAKLSGEGADAKGAAWSPVDESLIAICSAGKLAVWKLTEAGAKASQQATVDKTSFSTAMAWSKRDAAMIATASDSSFQIWDARSLKVASSKTDAHAAPIRCLDFANSSSNCLASCGDDSRVKVWDVRSLQNPLISLSDHAHWVWQCKFNPVHEQLLLSSSSDATVRLQHFPKLSKSAPKTATDSPNSSRQWQGSDASCVAVFDGHDDSVYGVAWSHADPWTFASISYDGRIIIGRVPSGVKYSILI